MIKFYFSPSFGAILTLGTSIRMPRGLKFSEMNCFAQNVVKRSDILIFVILIPIRIYLYVNCKKSGLWKNCEMKYYAKIFPVPPSGILIVTNGL